MCSCVGMGVGGVSGCVGVWGCGCAAMCVGKVGMLIDPYWSHCWKLRLHLEALISQESCHCCLWLRNVWF